MGRAAPCAEVAWCDHLCCVLLHELGHALVARRAEVNGALISCLPIGGVTLMEDMASTMPIPRATSHRRCRSLVNLAIAAVSGVSSCCFCLRSSSGQPPFVHAGNLPRALFLGQCVFGGFNLLPAYPMDGGRILRRSWPSA